MRLLSIETLTFKEFHQKNEPPYIAASHRWTADETSYKDVKKDRNTDTPGFQKVKSFCEAVKSMNHGLCPSSRLMTWKRPCAWLWIDTACIDKRSSAELSESLNSMFQYYANADACYAFLHDVGPLIDYKNAVYDFLKSEWFKWGWTLQELIAPKVVVFFTRHWEVFGHKCPLTERDATCHGFGVRLNTKIEKITGIPSDILRSYQKNADKYDLEATIKWTLGRVTTRPEDQVYCLLGLVGIFMAPLYGEGLEAWDRLEEGMTSKAIRREKRSRRLFERDSYDIHQFETRHDYDWAQSTVRASHQAGSIHHRLSLVRATIQAISHRHSMSEYKSSRPDRPSTMTAIRHLPHMALHETEVLEAASEIPMHDAMLWGEKGGSDTASLDNSEESSNGSERDNIHSLSQTNTRRQTGSMAPSASMCQTASSKPTYADVCKRSGLAATQPKDAARDIV
ncbi:hypothetical protein TI39_contig355g00008 [Zymoseptoria brevis]|uniref:Heterokaryon incompatibility domain-containing protein n=1 Tax=Zymoseptoria brevis TaxID=1047168 RepID=A0A0F4GTH8_9PEZI|nr:hypothetical protein TI39_contig355g00008 [Zymoseptoria brevis]